MPALIAPHQRTAPSFTSLSRLLLVLTILPLSLAAFAFLLQWRGPVPLDDPFPGLDNSPMSPYSSKVAATPALGCEEVLGRSTVLGFPHYRGWSFQTEDPDPNPKVSITTTTSAGLEQILPWLFYHKVVGVTQFFLFAEGKAATPKVAAVLESIPGVTVIPRTPELLELQSKSRIWNETWLSSYFYKPCNYELFVKQTLNMEMAILMARDAGMDWIIHLDTDELIHPAGAKEYSLRQLLSDLPSDVDMVIFPNYESSIERDDIKDPFSEVSMFKKNYDHLPKETYFSSYKEATRENPNYFLTYGNGKSAARIKDHLRPNGAHRWHNYRFPPKEIKMEEAAVLHYTYAKFSDLTSRRDRCSCKPTKNDVKRCFMLDFDQEAFIVASTVTEEEMLRWYREHVVWTDKELILKLLRKGIMTHIYAPMTIIQGLRASGVFSSAIASAQTLPKGKVSSSIETLHKYSSKLLSNDRSANSNKVGTSKESLATTRKILEIAEVFNHEIAVPPIPPPGFSYFDKGT